MQLSSSFLSGVSRSLFKRLRYLMQSDLPAEKVLSAFVSIIAEELMTDVCSCYLMTNPDSLELFSAYGLAKESVHKTILHVGEGLIGEIALTRKTLSVSDVWTDPRFSYRKETKEDDFHSLLGVPLLKENDVIGVLAVQTRENYVYSSEEIELLETVAMILAEFISASKVAIFDENVVENDTLEGVTLSGGLAIGRVVIHQSNKENKFSLFASDAETERARLDDAFDTMRRRFEEYIKTHEGEENDIFQTYLLFLKDKGWHRLMNENLQSGLSAEQALQKATEEMCNRMRRLNDAYLKERSYDFEDLSHRLLNFLCGESEEKKNSLLPNEIILVADTLGPAELLSYPAEKVKGLILAHGSATMHVAIIARSLGLPVLSEIEKITDKLEDGEDVLLNAESGILYMHPSAELKAEFQKQLRRRDKLVKEYARLKDKKSVTKCKTPIHLLMNAGLASDYVEESKGFAEGIGLYRTELPFMTAQKLPDLKTQVEIYQKVLHKGLPVTFRSLDIGADKALPYADKRKEENPAMGWRSVRLTLDRRALLKEQLKAFIQAADGQDLSVMFPMVSHVSEFLEAKETLLWELSKSKYSPSSVRIGSMIEVPSLIYELDYLLEEADFISVGTNDLAQFMFAMDRADPRIWKRYDVLSVPFLRLLKMIFTKANEAHVPCAVCGEIAGHRLEAMTLIGLGCRSLSMNAGSLGYIKNMILSLDEKNLASYLDFLLDHSHAETLRPTLKAYAQDHGIKIF